MSERSDPIHQDREGTSHQAQSLARHDRPLYDSEYDSEYDEESSEYDSEYTTEGPRIAQDNYDSEDDLNRAFQPSGGAEGEKSMDQNKTTQEQPTKEDVHSHREQIDSK
jgi:hypothetical protein